MTLPEVVDDALHNPTQLFTLPQIATHLEVWGEVGMAQALRTRNAKLEEALEWIKTPT